MSKFFFRYNVKYKAFSLRKKLLAITFERRVLWTWGQRFWVAFLMLFSGIPHLTIFFHICPYAHMPIMGIFGQGTKLLLELKLKIHNLSSEWSEGTSFGIWFNTFIFSFCQKNPCVNFQFHLYCTATCLNLAEFRPKPDWRVGICCHRDPDFPVKILSQMLTQICA